jgi:hypothetical protein
LAAESQAGTVGRYVVILAAALSILYRSSSAQHRRVGSSPIVRFTLLVGVFLIVHSFFVSSIVDVSVLKALSWTIAMSASVAGWNLLTQDERDALARQFYQGLILLMLVSLPLLALPQGYLTNGTGFQGVLSHPQAFGPTAALLGVWSAGRMFAERRPSWIAIAVVALCVVLAVLSESRAAGLSMVLGLTIAVVIAPALAGRTILSTLPGLRSSRVWIVVSLVMVGLLLSLPMITERIDNFIAKRGDAASLRDAYEVSRGELIDRMWDNIENTPFEGIGFGIASLPELNDIKREPIFDLPVSAVVEKGVMPLAVLEEVGIPGFLLIAVWFGMLLRRSALGGVEPLAVSITTLLLNMSESTFFSPGGSGLLSLLLVGWAYSNKAQTGK